MTSLTPRAAYTDQEIKQLYPAQLELQLVQVLLRHGERSPVSARFQNAGLAAFWPYCSAVKQMKSAVLDQATNSTDSFSTMEWKRRLEAFGPNDAPGIAAGPRGELDAICDMGMLTDRGRQTTHDLGVRLRKLYVEQLGFLPPTIHDTESMYLRATPIPRALESMQETFSALYPPHTRAVNFPPPAILSRAPADETLFPNDGNCRRFAQLSRAFAQRAAQRWNDTEDMAYVTSKIGKWMPEDSPKVAVDSHPRLSGVMDTVNSTLAHGPETRLPKEFYDKKLREIIEKIGVEEWFAGYQESREYRMLGIGSLMGDIVGRMVGSAERSTADGHYEVAQDLDSRQVRAGKGATPIRFGLSGCHDTTLAGILASLGALEDNKWPPYTSHIAVEMFRQRREPAVPSAEVANVSVPTTSKILKTSSSSGSWSSMFTSLWQGSAKPGNPPPGIGRKPTEELTASEKQTLEGYYVRIRYNDEVVKIPGCKLPGNHLEGDEGFCTLTAFKAIVDKYTPKDWKQQCATNIKAAAFPTKPEPAGYA